VSLRIRLPSIIMAITVVSLWSYETYLSSGWRAGFELSRITNYGGLRKAEREDGLKGWLTSRIMSVSRRPLECKTEDQLPGKPLAIWIAPYRRFPEVPGEGGSRKMGDYEYFSYLPEGSCSQIRVNYGAFKGSRADRKFSRIAKKGTKAEYLHALKKGFDLFILDSDKNWISSSFMNTCLSDIHCTATSDGFIAIELKKTSKGRHYAEGLVDSNRFGWQEEVDPQLLLTTGFKKGLAEESFIGWDIESGNKDKAFITHKREIGTGQRSIEMPVASDTGLAYNVRLELTFTGKIRDRTVNARCGRQSFILRLHPDSKKTLAVSGIEKAWRKCGQLGEKTIVSFFVLSKNSEASILASLDHNIQIRARDLQED
jgi:hypothetical protein